MALSQQAISDALQGFQHAGLSDTRDVEGLNEVLTLVRSRARNGAGMAEVTAQRTCLTRALQPLAEWLMTQTDVAVLDTNAKCALVWNLYTASVSRTVCADYFNHFTTSEEAWNQVVSTLFGNSGLGSSQDIQVDGSFWCRARLVLLAIMCLCFGADYVLTLQGRGRFYLLLVGTLCIAVLIGSFFFQEASAPGRVHHGGLSNGSQIAPVPANGPMMASRVELSAPPNLAPPFPQVVSSGPPMTSPLELVQQPSSGSFQTGDPVSITGSGGNAFLTGQRGTVFGVSDEAVEVLLDSGLKVGPLPFAQVAKVSVNMETVNPVASAGIGSFYAPFAIGGSNSKLQQQAARLRDALDKSSGLMATLPSWGSLFWQAVKNEEDLYGLGDSIENVLIAHGYVGPATISPPRVDELKKQLTEIETLGGPAHGSGGSVLRAQPGATEMGPENMSWYLKLPADLQRAAPELYRNIRAEGVSSVRQWVNEQHPTLEQKNSVQYQDLFMAATIIDFEVADCVTEGALMQKLATSDSLEIHLRKLGAFIYYRRTKDKTGANRMLGVRAPGTNADIAPKWMLDDANTHSKMEMQRIERGSKMAKSDYGGGGGGGAGKTRKGDGKGRGRGRGKPSSGPATQG